MSRSADSAAPIRLSSSSWWASDSNSFAGSVDMGWILRHGVVNVGRLQMLAACKTEIEFYIAAAMTKRLTRDYFRQ